MESQAVSTADDPMLELTMVGVVNGEILRVTIGAAEQATPPTPTPYAFYTATAAGTGGTAVTENIVAGPGTIQASVLRNLTALPVTGLREFAQGAVVWETGELWLPTPEERFEIHAGRQDFFGLHFLTAPSVAVTFTCSIVWAETG